MFLVRTGIYRGLSTVLRYMTSGLYISFYIIPKTRYIPNSDIFISLKSNLCFERLHSNSDITIHVSVRCPGLELPAFL